MHYLLAAIAFGLLIAFHELGHMWVAKRMGMRVERYSIGFGPALFTWRRGETEYVLSAFPLGGYVKVAGMATEEDEENDPNDEGSYLNKPAWKRLLVIAAGPAANYLLAFLVVAGLFMTANSERDLASTRLGAVLAGHPAATAGLTAGDEIRSVDGVEVHDWMGMRKAITAAGKAHPKAAVPFVYLRDGQTHTAMVTPDEGPDGFVIGVDTSIRRIPALPPLTALKQSALTMYDATVKNADGMWKIITRQTKGSLSGPIGILSQTAEQAKKGAVEFVDTVWALSVAVGFFNLLPVPGLDGGRLMFLTYEVVARRRVNRRVEDMVHAAGLIALLLLIVIVSFGDIMKFRV